MKYDTKEGITEAVKTLAGLNQLVRERSDAYQQRREPLNQWFVLRRLWMDACGNTMIRKEGEFDIIDVVIDRNSVPSLKGSFYGVDLPSENDTCVRCGYRWTIRDFFTARLVTFKTKTWKHVECIRFEVYDAAVAQMQELVGYVLRGEKIVTIPNRYWPQDVHESPPPWFRIITKEGDIIVGRRKKVWMIDWSGSTFPAVDFSDENVTFEGKMVHAWSEDKLVEYLRRIVG